MCLGIPMKVVEVENGETAVVEMSGVRRQIGLTLLEGVEVGDWVLLHAGFAISKLDEEQAAETLALLKEGGFIE